ncbi:MAG: shikimate kinase [Saprospirales bacterium]|nr:shikimate kinase [Saprospirales bacterium]
MEAPRPLFRASRSLFLIGLMGSGKTTTGKQLAGLLGWPFTDLDGFIEERQGCGIPDLFEKIGEPGFRKLEREALQNVLRLDAPRVVACGGGTPCYYDNLTQMKDAGWVIYLETPVPILVERLQSSTRVRPLLVGEDVKRYWRRFLSRDPPFTCRLTSFTTSIQTKCR